ITEEPFFRDNIGFIDELKLRASWGQTGREQASPWNYLEGASYGVGNGSVLDEEVVTGIRPRGLPSTNLSWVTATTRNLGVDFAFIDRKVAGSVDLFERRLSGIPAQRYDVLLPLEVGYDLPDENLNSQAIQGIEGMVTFTDRIGNVNFSIAPNATLARQKILDLYKPRYGNSLDRYFEAEENRWANVNFNLHAIGQFQNVEEIMNYPVNIDGRGNTTLLPGDLIFEDVNGDGIIDELDERPRGYSAGG